MRNILKNNFLMMKLIFRYCPQHIFITFFLSLFSSVISILSVLLTQKILDLLSGGYSILHISVYIFGVIGVNVLYNILSYINLAYLTPKNSIKLRYGLQMILYTESSHIEFSNFDDPSFYDKLSLAISQSDTRAIAVLSTFTSLITALFSVGALFVLLGQTTPELSVACCIAVGINLLLQLGASKNRHQFLVQQTSVQRKLSYIQQMFSSRSTAQEIRSTRYGFSLLEFYFSQFLKQLQELSLNYAMPNFWFGILPNFLDLLMKWGIIYFLAFCFLDGKISLGEFVSFNSASMMLFSQLNALFINCASLYTNGLCTEDFLQFVKHSPTSNSNTTGLALPEEITLNIQNLQFHYHNSQVNAITIRDLTIKNGEKVAIVGPNGSGKSTLIKLLGRLYTPSVGEIKINNHLISEYSFDSFVQDISIVWQSGQLFAVSIAENVLMKPFPHSEDETNAIIQALTVTNVYDKICTLPNGINTVLTKEFNENGTVLSGGELKKIALARAFARTRKIMIFDEPWNSLDRESIKNISEKLFSSELCSTIIIVTHDLKTVEEADKVIFIENGVIKQIKKKEMK